jgi:LysM repeat protein
MRIERPSGDLPAASGPTTHVAKEGETLASIAADYRVKPSALAKANQLPAGAEIRAGQELVIPFGKQAQAKAARGLSDVKDSFEMGAAAKAFAEGAASKAFVQGSAAKAFVEGSASKAFVEGSASKAFVEGAAAKAFVEGSASKAFVQGAAAKAFVEGSASKAFVEGAAAKAFVEGAAAKAFVEGAVAKAFVEGSASKAFVEGAASKAFVEGSALGSYIVRQGETLKSIANQLGVGVQDLAKANNLRSNARLAAGMELKLPAK